MRSVTQKLKIVDVISYYRCYSMTFLDLLFKIGSRQKLSPIVIESISYWLSYKLAAIDEMILSFFKMMNNKTSIKYKNKSAR